MYYGASTSVLHLHHVLAFIFIEIFFLMQQHHTEVIISISTLYLNTTYRISIKFGETNIWRFAKNLQFAKI